MENGSCWTEISFFDIVNLVHTLAENIHAQPTIAIDTPVQRLIEHYFMLSHRVWSFFVQWAIVEWVCIFSQSNSGIDRNSNWMSKRKTDSVCKIKPFDSNGGNSAFQRKFTANSLWPIIVSQPFENSGVYFCNAYWLLSEAKNGRYSFGNDYRETTWKEITNKFRTLNFHFRFIVIHSRGVFLVWMILLLFAIHIYCFVAPNANISEKIVKCE